jgi:hypothetical protein
VCVLFFSFRFVLFFYFWHLSASQLSASLQIPTCHISEIKKDKVFDWIRKKRDVGKGWGRGAGKNDTTIFLRK